MHANVRISHEFDNALTGKKMYQDCHFVFGKVFGGNDLILGIKFLFLVKIQ
jgi:hypothetical protein